MDGIGLDCEDGCPPVDGYISHVDGLVILDTDHARDAALGDMDHDLTVNDSGATTRRCWPMQPTCTGVRASEWCAGGGWHGKLPSFIEWTVAAPSHRTHHGGEPGR